VCLALLSTMFSSPPHWLFLPDLCLAARCSRAPFLINEIHYKSNARPGLTYLMPKILFGQLIYMIYVM
jgi:hypothetical protein